MGFRGSRVDTHSTPPNHSRLLRNQILPLRLVFVETDDEFGPFGAKGVGEPGLVPTAPAIGNAVYNAVGIRIHDLPITPEKVLRALKQKRTGGPSVPESTLGVPRVVSPL